MDTQNAFFNVYFRPLFGFVVVVFVLAVNFFGFPLDEALRITATPTLATMVILFLLGGIFFGSSVESLLLFIISLICFLAIAVDVSNIFDPLNLLIGAVCVSMTVVFIFNASIASARKNMRFFPRLIWELLMPIAVALGIYSTTKEGSLFLLCVSFLLLFIQMYVGRLYNYGYRKLLYSK